MATNKQLENWFKSFESFKNINKGILGQYEHIFKSLNSPAMLKSIEQLRNNLFGIDKLSQLSIEIKKSISFPFNSQLRSLQESLKNISLPLNSFTKTVLEFEKMSKEWKNQYLGAAGPLLKTQYDFSLQFSKISELSYFSSSILKQLSNDHFASIIELSKIREKLLSSQINFSNSYSLLFKHYDDKSIPLYSLPSTHTIMPATEFYNSAFLSKSFSYSEENIEYSKEEEYLFNEIKEDNKASLDDLLIKIDKKYMKLLIGAREALNSANTDRIRHFSVSLRELFTHILHHITPDSEVRKWSDDPKYYENGKLTRRARLEYLYSSIYEKPFKKFVETDIKSSLEFLSLFQEGTHSLIDSFTDLQLKAMLQRMESLLYFLLIIKHQ